MHTNLPRFASDEDLITAIAQDAGTGEVLMLAHMNRAAWRETLATGYAVYYSRSRRRLWKKGEQSGHVQLVREIYVDCDGDAVLLKVEQTGAACHEGYASCFFRRWTGDDWKSVGAPLVSPASTSRRREADYG